MGKLRVGLIAALTAFAVASCSKVEQDVPIGKDSVQESQIHYIQVTLGKDDTKTSVEEGNTEASYVWTEGDDQYLHVYENDKAGTISAIAYSADHKTATVTVGFTGSPSAPYTYTAKYANTLSNSKNPLIPAQQQASASSFDPAADVMISMPDDAAVTGLNSRATSLSFKMGRVVSINKMILTGLVAGEKVSKVELTLEKVFVGGHFIGEGNYNGLQNKLTVIYSTPLTVGADGKLPVYFTCAPVENSGITEVKVTTDQHLYTKPSSEFTGKSISFALGVMTRFNMGMSGYGADISGDKSYTLVQSQSDFTSGSSYLIVGNDDDLAAMAGQNNNNRAMVGVTANNNVITINNTTGAYSFTITSVTGGYTIQDNSNSYYLYNASTEKKNYLRSRANVGSDNLAKWTINIENGIASILNVGYTDKPYMCYNYQSSLFACYAAQGTHKTLSLYKRTLTPVVVEALATPTNVAAVNNNGTVTVTWNAVTGADSYTVTCTGQATQTGLTECSAVFNNLDPGDYTITVKAISNDHTVKLDSEAASTVVNVPTPATATATVTTVSASDIKATQVTLNGSFTGATGQIYETGFYYGTSANNLNINITTDGSNASSGVFSCGVTGLTESTTYYYKAYVLEFNASTSQYEERYGDVRSFTTAAPSVQAPGYLSCYEVPDVTGILSGSGTNGSNSGRDDIWYRYYTNNDKRQIAVHTFTHPTSNSKTRNYTVLYDGNNYAPLWTAHAMHTSMWPDDGSGRTGNWTTDPAIGLTQQTGLDNASSVGYSRGHFVASQERQSSTKQNAQTFYYTNQAPQWQNSFNGGIWSALEQDVVSHAPSGRDTLYVVTGVLYEGTTTTLPSGSLNVRIPSHFYKCLMKCSFDTGGNMTAANGIAYIYTNEAHSGHYYDTTTSIDAIEARAGFDFFPKVPSSLQNAAEANTNQYWFNGQGTPGSGH